MSDFLFPPPLPFLTGISEGGGIAIASSAPVGIGVPFDVEAVWAGEPSYTGKCCGVLDEVDSALTISSGAGDGGGNLASIVALIDGDTLKVTILDFGFDARPAPLVIAVVLMMPAIAVVMDPVCCGV